MKITMKKMFAILLITSFLFQSCATILGGQVGPCQAKRPNVGEPPRQLRMAPFVADILLFPLGLGIDFITHAIYKPCPAVQKENKERRQIDPIYGISTQ